MADRPGAPEPLVVGTVIDVTRALARNTTLGTWLTDTMFVPDASHHAELSPFERGVLDGLDVLADVCLRPHDRLDRVDELVRADLARRVPHAGLARLAGHTEDWAGVEHGRIMPLRVLSQRFAEDVDFYENQVAAQLVDRLGEHLTRRIRELTTLADGLTDLNEYNRALKHAQSWRRLDRVARLVAKAVSDTTASALAVAETLDVFRRARTRLAALHGSPVLRRANRRVPVPIRLMRTNLFLGDRRYRQVGALWELWAVHESSVVAGVRSAERAFPDAYAHYVAALSLRALAILGYQPDDPADALPVAGSTVLLRGPAGSVTWSMAEDGTLHVAGDGQHLARLAPVSDDLGHPDAERARSAALSMQADSTIVVYPGLRTARAAPPSTTEGLVHPAGFGALPCLVPVTPLEIEGEERLARALRWVLQGRRFVAEYPPTAELYARLPSSSGDWSRPAGPTSVAVTRRPSMDEVESLVRAATAHERDLRRSTAFSQTRAKAAVEAAVRSFDLFETCPVCHSTMTEFEPRDRNTFQCRCRNCSTGWGTRICGSCRKVYPVLWLHNVLPDGTSGDRVDVTAGADLLSVPCVDDRLPPGVRFRCSWCGACAGHPGCGCPVVPSAG
ncbi:hypothetical protein AB0J72_45235 [Dactylosporangium sp. NPDC049742]|uniref:DUF2357 domain-containing protein n=1 Tax=Dactylosporangium sp. NPDC049742 TaxID=3154737 RepID=UPI003418B4FD